MEKYISSCHKAFTIFEKNEILCSECKKIVHKLEENESINISKIYNNINDGLINININNHIASRFATDKTFMITDKICPKNHKNEPSYCRFARDYNKNPIYICSDSNCRHVWK